MAVILYSHPTHPHKNAHTITFLLSNTKPRYGSFIVKFKCKDFDEANLSWFDPQQAILSFTVTMHKQYVDIPPVLETNAIMVPPSTNTFILDTNHAQKVDIPFVGNKCHF